MKKTTVISLILIALLIFTISCSSPNTIEVTSKDYPKLTEMEPEEFDDNKLREATRSEYQYSDYTCYLTVKDEKLCIENKTDYFSSTCEVGMNFGYLVGLDRGEFDGWVRWFPDGSSYYPEGEEPEILLVAKENCRFIIVENNQNAYIVTVNPSLSISFDGSSGETYVYGFEIKWDPEVDSEEHEITWAELAKLSGEAKAYYYSEEDECIYFATDMGITKITFGGEIEEMVRVDFFSKIGVNSIVKLHCELYCGTALGIYRYNPETGESLWYPMNYEKYVEQ